WEVESRALQRLPEGTQPQTSVEDNCELVVRSGPKVQALAKVLGVEPPLDRFQKGQRLQQALLFARFPKHDNLHPPLTGISDCF
ncbi:hypothetical protein EDD15DRAFT_2189038, partial [Pisolithus albus]